MSKCTTLVIVRHGETMWNSQGRWQGWLDSPLSERGLEQARQAREELAQFVFDAAYSSDSGRAFQTAEVILEGKNVPLETTPALRERLYGGYEGLNTQEIDEQFPGTRYKEGLDCRELWAPPDGESMRDVRLRVELFLKQVVSSHPGQTVLLVTHSGVVRAIDRLIGNASFNDIWHRTPHNCCVYVVRACADGTFEVVQDFIPVDTR